MLRLFWTKQQIRAVGPKLKEGLVEKHVHLFLIGVPDEPEPAQASGNDQNGSDIQSNTTTDSDRKLTSKNLDMKKTAVLMQTRRAIYHTPGAGREIIQHSMTKEQAIAAFRENFTAAQDNFIDIFVFYYSGKGNEKGEWVLNEGHVLSISEVLDLAVECKLEAHIDIEADADYAGATCYEAKKWFESFQEKRNDSQELRDVVPSLKVQGNVHKSVACVKDEYRKMYS